MKVVVIKFKFSFYFKVAWWLISAYQALVAPYGKTVSAPNGGANITKYYVKVQLAQYYVVLLLL